ncbi:MAG: class I SAM-dependent methyltransferase, partial [Flavobacteriales bacterium]|nr:class I SAM-dependent methyltransferase [Flavobacteriales bacterium]
ANSKLVVGDITAREEIDLESNYDLIILRDVIEHIEDKKKAFEGMSDLLKTNGHLFMAFPLKYSAYAGHQQTSKTWLRYFPFIALFPSSVIRKVCKMANDSGRTEELLYLKKCALTYRRMRRLTKEGWKIHHIDFFISRPIYQYRFGWRIIKMLNIPLLRELSNGCELILQKKSE